MTNRNTKDETLGISRQGGTDHSRDSTAWQAAEGRPHDGWMASHKRRSDMAKKDRSDKTVGSLEKQHGLPAGTVRNPNGRDTRSDKKIGTIRKERKDRR
jgi:hypothetical protein